MKNKQYITKFFVIPHRVVIALENNINDSFTLIFKNGNDNLVELEFIYCGDDNIEKIGKSLDKAMAEYFLEVKNNISNNWDNLVDGVWSNNGEEAMEYAEKDEINAVSDFNIRHYDNKDLLATYSISFMMGTKEIINLK